MLALVVLVELVLMGSHVSDGGLYTDDWQIAGLEQQLGMWGLFDALISVNRDRPLGALYLSSQAALSGTNTQVHALWGLATHLLSTMSLYLLLRVLRLQAVHAVPIALLVLVFPFSDSIWLWASLIPLSIALAALGAVLAIRGLERRGRPAVAYHLGAAALFAASILTYQAAALAICLLGLVYLSRTSARRALRRWAADVVVVALAVGLPRLIAGSGGSGANTAFVSVDEQVRHARLLADQGVTLFTAALVPIGRPHHRAIVISVLAVLVVAAVLAARAPRTGAKARGELRRWLGLAVAGGLLVAAAYAVYVPGPVAFYQPLAEGSDNRVNGLAGVGLVIVAYAMIMLAATLAARGLRRPQAAPLVGLALAAVLLSQYSQRVRQDVRAWDAAAGSQREQLAELEAGGRPPKGTALYVFGGKGVTAPGVYAFRVTWDLDGAVKLLWDDPSLRAYPIFAGTVMDCGKSGVVPIGPGNGNGPLQASGYGLTTFVDLRTDRRASVPSRQACRSLQPTFVPGPVTG